MEKKKLHIVAIALIIVGLGLAAFSATSLIIAKNKSTNMKQANNTLIINYAATASLYALTEKNLLYPNGSATITSQGAIPAKLVHKSYGVFSFTVKTQPRTTLSPIRYKVLRLLNIGPFTIKLNETTGETLPGRKIVIELGLPQAKNTSITLLHSIGLPVTTDTNLELRLEASTRIAGTTITMNPAIKISLGYNEPLYKVTITSDQGTSKASLPIKQSPVIHDSLTSWRKTLTAIFSIGIISALTGAALYARSGSHEPGEILSSLTVPMVELSKPPKEYLEAENLEDLARLAERNGQPLFIARRHGLACIISSGLSICAKLVARNNSSAPSTRNHCD